MHCRTISLRQLRSANSCKQIQSIIWRLPNMVSINGIKQFEYKYYAAKDIELLLSIQLLFI